MNHKCKSCGSLKCLRCEHNWFAREEEPKVCPSCNSPYWNRPRQK